MGLLTLKEVDEFSHLLKPLEEQEPVLSAWRCNCSELGQNTFEKLWSLANNFRKLLKINFKKLEKPCKGQVVILIIRDTPSTFGNLLPLIQSLYKKGNPPFLIVNDKTKRILNEGFYKGFFHVRDIWGGVQFKDKFNVLLKTNKYSKEFMKILKCKKNLNYFQWILDGLCSYHFFENYFKKDIFLLADSDIGAFEKGMFIAYNKISNRSAILQHGFFNKRLFPIHAHYHFDWGPYFSKKAEEYGHPLNRSVSLGCPRFDVIEELKRKPKDEKFLEKYNLKSRPVVLAISGVHSYDLYPKSVEAFFESVKALIDNNISVLIRRHPAEIDICIYAKFLGDERIKKCSFAEANEDLYEIMRNCDLVYQFASASSIEAMLFGIPVLWEKEGECNPFPDICNLGGGKVTNCQNIVEIVKEIEFNKSEREKIIELQENFLKEAIVNRKNATTAIVEYILD